MDRQSSKTLLLLMDEAGRPTINVQSWLTDNGLVAWCANDVCHAIEELSDFTVNKRPDVVMLEVQSINETYDTLRDALEPDAGPRDIRVVALGSNSRVRTRDRFFADDLDELKVLISDEMGRPEMALR